MTGQWIVFGTLLAALALFVQGRWRYDVVALLALLAVTVTGVVPAERAFLGFGHPAVVTVAAVLVVSRGLQNAGLVDLIARWLTRVGANPTVQVASLTAFVTVCSAFMNNVGALALLLPVGIQMARKAGRSPSYLLMPLAFGSLLGGMTTLIGTPPNIIIATFRAQNGGVPFRMFDFTPVGGGVAVAGLAFIALLGWRLIPQRKGQAAPDALFEVASYMTEVRVPEGSPVAGKTIAELQGTDEGDVVVGGLIRGERRRPAPSAFETLREGDVLIVQAESATLKTVVEANGLELVGSENLGQEDLGSDEIVLAEAVVSPGSPMDGQTARGLNLRWRHGVNLLAVARRGQRLTERLGGARLRAGDVVLLQAPRANLFEALASLGCLPLAERGLRLGQARRILLASGLFASALALAATGALPVGVAFVATAVAMILTRVLAFKDAYESVEWPVVVLLGAMIPVGEALEATGGAALIARAILHLGNHLPPLATLAVVLVGTMFLSDLVNNAAAAVLMAPIALGVARGLGAAPDPFLLAVAVGASCAFLTPIGHQSNTLVMGPGGYEFGDYWRLGLPLEIAAAAVAIPLLAFFWPLGVP